MQVGSLGQEDPLEKKKWQPEERKKLPEKKKKETAWRIPWTEEPDLLQSIASQRVRHD